MDKPYEPPIKPLTEDWKKDKAAVIKLAETLTKASEYFKLVQAVEAIFNRYAPNAVSDIGYAKRIGLSRKIHDELYPIAHFARLHFRSSDDVWIQWRNGSQSFDATVEDRRFVPQNSIIHFLEVTTLQDEQGAKDLQQLNSTGIRFFESCDHPHNNSHQRKIESLKIVLEKKTKINYPPNTALLIYTDENRYDNYDFSKPSLETNKVVNYDETIKAMQVQLFAKFEAACVYSREKIYCWLTR